MATECRRRWGDTRLVRPAPSAVSLTICWIRRGENGERVWDALVWILIPGIIGARLWYVVNATVGGNRYYIENPIQILNIPQGGLHFFGGLLFGGIALVYFARSVKLDLWLLLDAIAPGVLIGQGIGRIANFINQELYGPPTTLPWGIPISAEHRLPQFPVSQFPVETTRFHPTFAYEMIWNFAMAGILLWVSKRYEKQIKPGTIFAGWLLAAGVGRAWIEIFRPDQPKIPGLGISYSTIVSALMAIFGAILLMARYKALKLQAAENWEEEYKISTAQLKPQAEEVEIVEEPKTPTPRVKKASVASAKSATVKKTAKKAVKKTTAPKKKPATRTKKSSSE